MYRQEDVDQFTRELAHWDQTFRYQLLDRMRTDCEYLLGPGARLNKYLWARDPQLQIVYMKALWNSFPEGQKPEWLSFTRICQLERQMMAQPGQNKEDEI